ncbi:hypothetical protein [Yeosuana marina]|uniref:hypothetical protein n=1 Tax=Yeosuana marina TaxID=1565536 RepID=UPI0030C7AE09
MFNQIFKYYIKAFLCVLVCVSCTKDVDFNQFNDLQLTPVFESSLVYIDEPANKFLVNGNETSYLQDSVNIDFFNDSFVVDHLVKAEFLLETTNSINRRFMVEVDMFDDSNQLQHRFSFSSSESPDHSPLVTEHLEVFENDALDALKNTTKLVFTLYILPGEPINETTLGRITLKSKGSFYLKIER